MIEKEIKFIIQSKEIFENIKKINIFKFVPKNNFSLHHYITHYYDTPKYLLKKNNIELRLRTEKNNFVQTIKIPSLLNSSLLVRKELNKKLHQKKLDLTEVNNYIRNIGKKINTGNLSIIFSTKIRRSKFLIEFNRSSLECCFDTVKVHDLKNRKERVYYEIEIELIKGKEIAIFEFAKKICSKFFVQQNVFTKSDFGYSLISNRFKLRPIKWPKSPFIRNCTKEELIFNIVNLYLKNNPNYIRNKIEAIHQSRVMLRRLRSVIRAYKKNIDYLDRKGLNGEIKWLQQSLGLTRDWQVLLIDVIPKLKDLKEKTLVNITNLSKKNTAKQLKYSEKTYNSKRTTNLIINIQLWILNQKKKKSVGNLNKLKTLKDDLQSLSNINKSINYFDDNDLHKLRILLKKLRYTFDILEINVNKIEVIKKEIISLQGLFGDYNDLVRSYEIISPIKQSILPTSNLNEFKKNIEKNKVLIFSKLKTKLYKAKKLSKDILQEKTIDSFLSQ